jgi:hypothetical protein
VFKYLARLSLSRTRQQRIVPRSFWGGTVSLPIRLYQLQALDRFSATNFDWIEPDALRSPKNWLLNRPQFQRTLRVGLTALTEVLFD